MCKRIQRAVIPVIETLEGRVLLSASIQGTTLMVEGNATAPNKINVSFIRKTHSIRVVENRVRQDFAVSGLTAMQINGGTSKDVIAIAAGVTLPTTINGMGGNDLITGGAENDTIVTGPGSSVIYPGLGVNSIDLTLGSNKAVLSRKAVDTIIATKQDKVVGATKTTQIEAPSTPAGAPVSPPAPPAPPAPPLPPAQQGPPELIPGSGFSGPTPQPAQVGTGFGSTENAIARWDVVPDQTFSGTFNVGVIAFDINAIDHVAFSVNGGDWSNVPQMTLNPQTNVVEYTAQLNANDFPTDGQVEVRAIAVPTAGVPRVLDSLFLNSNKNGNLDERYVYVSPTGNDATADGTQAHPYQTLLAAATYNTGGNGTFTLADNLTIYLEAGDYAWPKTYFYENPGNINSWMTVTAAPGVDPATTRITSLTDSSSPGFNMNFVHLQNLTVGDGTNGIVLNGNTNSSQSLWLDSVNWDGPGTTDNSTLGLTVNQFTNVYWTNCTLEHTSAQIRGNLVRGCTVSDAVVAYEGVPFIINSTASDLYIPAGTQDHTDVAQQFNGTPGWGNIIYYGLIAKGSQIDAQGITLGPAAWSGVAIVNCDIEVTGSATAFSAESQGGISSNLLIQGSTFGGPVTGWLDSTGQISGTGSGTPFDGQDIVIRDTSFLNHDNLQYPGVTFE